MKISELKNIIRKEISKENDYPKNKWIQVTDRKEIEDLKDNLFQLIKTAYANIGGHFSFKSPEDVLDPELDFWKVADLDQDPEIDVTTFGYYTPHGIKHTGMGHDGDKANVKNLLTHKTKMLKTPGNYVELSGAAFDSFVGYGGAPVIEDEEIVRDILGSERSKEMEWHGSHPTNPSEKGNGWYTRTLGGGRHTKSLVGIPN